MPTQITVYSLAEMKQLFPDVYKQIWERWKSDCSQEGSPWSKETMDSLKAIVAACNGKLTDWNIGPFSPSSCSVNIEEPSLGPTEEDDTVYKDLADWFFRNILRPHGYKDPNVFPGQCGFTGYCADDDMAEAVHNKLTRGSTLRHALESLADVASTLMEQDLEQHQEEENMLANWENDRFTDKGVLVG